MDSIKSFLKGHILKSKARLNITDSNDFPEFCTFYGGYRKVLKSKGNGDTTHNPELPKTHLQSIDQLLILLHKAMIGNAFIIDETQTPPVKTLNPEYQDLLKKIPKYAKGMYVW